MSRVLILGCDTQLSQHIGDALSAARLPMEYVAGPANALSLLRVRSFGVVITSPQTAVKEDLKLLDEMRKIRPGLRFIVLADHSTPEEVIAALRANVFACFTPPFHVAEIVSIIRDAIPDTPWEDDIEVLSPGQAGYPFAPTAASSQPTGS